MEPQTVSFTLQDPRPALQSLILQGKSLFSQVENSRPGPFVRKVGHDIGNELARGVLDKLGLPLSWAHPATKAIARNSSRQQEQQWEQAYTDWAQRVVQTLGTVSTASRHLKTSGNSQRRIERFSKTRSAIKIETRLRNGIAHLETLVGHELVYNGEIPQLLKRRQAEKAAETRRLAELKLLDIPELAPGIDALKFPNRAALHQQLSEYPEERAMLEAAIDAFLGDGQDRYRHAMTSARSALESMGRRITRAPDWKKAIERRTNKETAKMFTVNYQFLSSYTHPGRTPTKGAAELGLKQTIGLVMWLVAHEQQYRVD